MKFPIKHISILIITVMLAINCDVANINDDQTETIEKELIIYTSNKNGTVDIYLANNDGTNQTRLTNDDLRESNPVISPDGKSIAYIRENQVWTMSLDGENPKDVYQKGEARSVSWSPDSKKLIVSLTNSIVVVDADGRNAITHVVTENSVPDLNAKMNPGGTLILYSAPVGRTNEIFLLNWKTKESSQLTENNVNNKAPSWSPDGSEILYASSDAVGTLNLFTMTVSGKSQTQITTFKAGTIDQEVNPCWANEEEIYLTTLNTKRDGSKQKKAQDHNASRSNTTSGIMSDIVTEGDVIGVSCSQKVKS